MDSDNAEQHDNYVQRHDGHEQDDENPQNGRDERQEHSRAVEHDAEKRHEQDEADDGSDHVRDRDRLSTVNAWFAAHPPRSPCGVISQTLPPWTVMRPRLGRRWIVRPTVPRLSRAALAMAS